MRPGSRAPISSYGRIALAVLVFGIQSLHFLRGSPTSGGIIPRMPFECYPNRPISAVPYVLCYPPWLGGLMGAACKMEDRLFRSLMVAYVLTFGSAQHEDLKLFTYQATSPGDP